MRFRDTMVLLWVVLAAACSDERGSEEPVETIAAAPLRLSVDAEGELKASKAQPLLVPGEQWQQRQLVWIAPDGSRVKTGDLVARFSAANAELELDKAVLDLERNLLARAGKQDELAATGGRVGVDLSKVGTDLAIAERYAGADFSMLARNDILDAIQDRGFLDVKRGVLQWRLGQAEQRGGAELAVLDTQKATFALNAERRRGELDALELRAPNDGVLVLSADWSGEKPKLGATMWAGEELASLPDAGELELQLSLPQMLATGVHADQRVDLHPVGRPAENVASRLSWVASAAQQKGRNDPVKYLAMKAAVPAEEATRYGWVPGQAFRATIVLAERDEALSVANVALRSNDGVHEVLVRDGDGWTPTALELGVRGPARSEVLSGLAPGAEVRLVPAPTEAEARP